MGENIIVRKYRVQDSDAVYALILSILETEFADIPVDMYLDDIANVLDVYQGERNQFFVCEDAGKIIGTVAIKEDDADSALLRRLFLNPNYRGKGIGKMLVESAIEFCKTQKYKKLNFDGNTKMHHVKKILLKYGFSELEGINLPGFEIFKLSYKLT